MAIPLVVSIVGDAKGLEKGLGDAAGKVNVFGRSFDRGAVLKVAAFAGVAVIAIDKLAELGAAAQQDAYEAEKLATAIDAAGAATGDWSAQVENAIAKGQDLVFTDTEIRDALTPLVGVFGDVSKATEALGLAQDVARLKGVDLATAADAVAKAEDGSAGSLAKLLKISAEGKTSAEVLAEAQRLAAGQAVLYGDDNANAAEKAAIKWSELGEKIGTLVQPVMSFLMDTLNTILDWLDEIGGDGGAAAALGRGFDKIRPALVLAGDVLRNIAGALSAIVGFAIEAAKKVADLVDALGKLNPLANDKTTFDILQERLNQGPGLDPGMAGVTGGPGGRTQTINVYAAGADGESIVRALRRWAGVNGGLGGLHRAIEAGG